MRLDPGGNGSRQRRAMGGTLLVALAGGLLALALGVPAGQGGCGGPVPSTEQAVSGAVDADDNDTATGPWTPGNRGKYRKNPVNACRAAGGTCVGPEDGACARGNLGDARSYDCGGALRCCLP